VLQPDAWVGIPRPVAQAAQEPGTVADLKSTWHYAGDAQDIDIM
jgi:hypothetical protein